MASVDLSQQQAESGYGRIAEDNLGSRKSDSATSIPGGRPASKVGTGRTKAGRCF